MTAAQRISQFSAVFAPGQKFGRAIDAPNTRTAVLTEAVSPHTQQAYAGGYRSAWDSLVLKPNWLAACDAHLDRMVDRRADYTRVEMLTGVPWFFVAIVHALEGGGDFGTWLANGDPLSAPTRQVPAGLGKGRELPLKWSDAAAISLEHQGLSQETDWSLVGICFQAEAFNGFGYRSKGINSPYLYAQSNLWTRGKYVADGAYDKNAGSSQIGFLSYLKRGWQRGLFDIRGLDGGIAPAPQPAPEARAPEIKRGASGFWVVQAQHLINGCGYGPLTEDGQFGPLLETEVLEFQRDLGLTADGEIGPVTWDALQRHKKLPGWKPLSRGPEGGKGAKGLRGRVVAIALENAEKGRSHAPANWIDVNVLDPLRPAMVKLKHLGASDKDNFWNWCAAWVTYIARQSGLKVPDRFTHPGSWASVALVEEWQDFAESIGAWIPFGTRAPRLGDFVVYDWNGDRLSDHIGVVTGQASGGCVAAEGNKGNREVVLTRSSGIRGFIDLEIFAARVGLVESVGGVVA